MEALAAEQEIGSKIRFHGFVTDHLQLMSKMDLILLTSESEGVPRCLMEALAIGKTVIASDIQGVKKLILDGRTGYLFPVGDVDGLASRIIRVIQDKAFLPPERLVEFIEDNYDSRVVCGVMLKKIEQVLAGRLDP